MLLSTVMSSFRMSCPRSLQLHYHFNAVPAVSGLQVVSAVTSKTLLHRSDETYSQPQVITLVTLIS